jgi:hypothetical protein
MKDKHYPTRALTAYYRAMTRHHPGDLPGVAGVIGDFFTVVEMAKITTLWPWLSQLPKCFKSNRHIWPHFTGGLATLA